MNLAKLPHHLDLSLVYTIRHPVLPVRSSINKSCCRKSKIVLLPFQEIPMQIKPLPSPIWVSTFTRVFNITRKSNVLVNENRICFCGSLHWFLVKKGHRGSNVGTSRVKMVALWWETHFLCINLSKRSITLCYKQLVSLHPAILRLIKNSFGKTKSGRAGRPPS